MAGSHRSQKRATATTKRKTGARDPGVPPESRWWSMIFTLRSAFRCARSVDSVVAECFARL